MMYLRFERMRDDVQGPTLRVTGNFIQITYNSVCDAGGEMLAHYDMVSRDWLIADKLDVADKQPYSDIIIWQEAS